MRSLSNQKDIHVKVDKEFHEEFSAALKKLRWKTKSSFFQHAMRELIKEAELRSKEEQERISLQNRTKMKHVRDT